MAHVRVLIPGHADDNASMYWSTISLIQLEGLNIIVDPGAVPTQERIIRALAEVDLTPADIHMVAITHSHLDHYRNIGMFHSAKTLDFWGLWQHGHYQPWGAEKKCLEDIEILFTPGHSSDSITLLVTTSMGKVAICGDLFWNRQGPETDLLAMDMELLKQNRQRIVKLADYIIPGHADGFKTSELLSCL